MRIKCDTLKWAKQLIPNIFLGIQKLMVSITCCKKRQFFILQYRGNNHDKKFIRINKYLLK